MNAAEAGWYAATGRRLPPRRLEAPAALVGYPYAGEGWRWDRSQRRIPTYEDLCCRQCGGVDSHSPTCRWADTGGRR